MQSGGSAADELWTAGHRLRPASDMSLQDGPHLSIAMLLIAGRLRVNKVHREPDPALLGVWRGGASTRTARHLLLAAIRERVSEVSLKDQAPRHKGFALICSSEPYSNHISCRRPCHNAGGCTPHIGRPVGRFGLPEARGRQARRQASKGAAGGCRE